MEQKNIITRTRVEYYIHYIGPLKAAGERITRHMSTWVAYSKKDAQALLRRAARTFFDEGADADDFIIIQKLAEYQKERWRSRYWTAFKKEVRTNEAVTPILVFPYLVWITVALWTWIGVANGGITHVDSLLWWSLLFPVGFMLFIWGVGSLLFLSESTEDVHPVQEEVRMAERITLAKS